MGRKGIGKLSLFSIAETVEVYTVKNGERHGFRMNVGEIKEAIRKEENGTGSVGNERYTPTPLDDIPDDLTKGTRIVLTDLKKRVHTAETALKKRLARRFSILGPEYDFEVRVNGYTIDITDRDYFHKVQFLWTYEDDRYVDYCRDQKLQGHEDRTGETEEGYTVRGWIGTVEKPSDLVEKHPGKELEEDDLNKISLMVRGKMAKPDLLEDINDGRVFTKYLVGEIHADFLDFDDDSDIATSDREDIVREDPRYQDLLDFLKTELNRIALKWDEFRNEQGAEEARMIPAVDMWFESLSPDQRDQAKKLFGKINQLSVDEKSDKKELFKHGVLAFEQQKYEKNLNRLQGSTEDTDNSLPRVFSEVDEVEASRFHQVVKQRLEILRKIQSDFTGGNHSDVLLGYLFERPWLLDPSWERPTVERNHFGNLSESLEELDRRPEDSNMEVWSQVNVVRTSHGPAVLNFKHPQRNFTVADIFDEIFQIHRTVEEWDDPNLSDSIPVFILLGKYPPAIEQERKEVMAKLNDSEIIVRTYDEALTEAIARYQDYIGGRKDGGRIGSLLEQIESSEIWQ